MVFVKDKYDFNFMEKVISYVNDVIILHYNMNLYFN